MACFARGGHDLDHVHFFGADAQTILAGGAKPEFGRFGQVHACLGVTIKFARTIIADNIHRADGDALGALVAIGKRFRIWQVCDLLDQFGRVFE